MAGTPNDPKLVTYRLIVIFGVVAAVVGGLTGHFWWAGAGLVLLGIGIALRPSWGKEK
jgi:hypothetical protein